MKVNKISIWRGFKMGATITRSNGMVEVAEASVGGSLECWKDDRDTVESCQNKLVGMMQVYLEAQAVETRAKLRELAGDHVEIKTVILESEPKMGDEWEPGVRTRQMIDTPVRTGDPPAPPHPGHDGSPPPEEVGKMQSPWCKGLPIGDGNFSGCAGLNDCPVCHGSQEPDIKIWFARDKGRMVSDLDLNALGYAITKGKIYRNGKAAGADTSDNDAYVYALAVDYHYKKMGGK